MVNIAKLRGIIKKRNQSVLALSEGLGMDVSTFYRKLSKNGNTFTLEQAYTMMKMLDLNVAEVQEIFFDKTNTEAG